MHIGFVTLESPYDPSRGGGIAAYLRAVIPGLLRAGHRVTVIANAAESREQYVHGGAVRVVHFRLPGLHWYLSKMRLAAQTVVLPLRQMEWSFGFYRLARRVFQTDPADVLESTEVGALLLGQLPCTSLVIRLHGSDYVFRKYSGEPLHLGARWNHRLEQIAWRHAQAITSPSHFQAREAARAIGWSPKRIHVVPNPIAPEMLIQALRHRPVTNNRSPIVLYTGRLARVKGTPILLEAAKEVRKAVAHAQIVLAGPWQLSEKPEQWGLASNRTCETLGVRWLGHVPWQQLEAWYRKAAVFVMPSLYETFGISVLEAMAFELPVIATTAGGLPEVVEDGVTGILVPPGDPRALREAISQLLRDPDLRRRMGQAGRERVLAEFTEERVVDQLQAVYRQVVKQR